jgi:hypothetical protein
MHFLESCHENMYWIREKNVRCAQGYLHKLLEINIRSPEIKNAKGLASAMRILIIPPQLPHLSTESISCESKQCYLVYTGE